MAWEGKKYKLDKADGFDEYMKALGKLIHLSWIPDFPNEKYENCETRDGNEISINFWENASPSRPGLSRLGSWAYQAFIPSPNGQIPR